jgi:hypothetical protein
MNVTTTPHLTDLIHLSTHISRYSFNFRDEVELHGLLEQAMHDGGWHVEREVKLGDKDRIDFMAQRMIDGKASGIEVGVEAKVKASLAQVERQLRRYAAHARVACILVVSCSVQLSRLPPTIEGKPIRVAIAIPL